MLFANHQQSPRILNHRVNLEPIANDSGVAQQSRALLTPISSHSLKVEPLEGCLKVLAFLEYRQPAQARLIDLKRQPFKQRSVVPNRKTILLVVIRAMIRMARGNQAVTH